MKSNIIFFVGMIMLSGCNFTEENELTLNDLREKARKSNEELASWERFEDSVYVLAESDFVTAIKAIDNKMLYTSNRHRQLDLHFIKGEVYYHYDSISKAIDEFTKSMPSQSLYYPKSLAARAGAYIKNKEYSKAHTDLNNAVKINYDYLWNLGNYYEIISKPDSAIYTYTTLYQIDPTVYEACYVRITELRQKNPKLLKELIYKDRQRISLRIEML